MTVHGRKRKGPRGNAGQKASGSMIRSKPTTAGAAVKARRRQETGPVLELLVSEEIGLVEVCRPDDGGPVSFRSTRDTGEEGGAS